MPVNSEELRSLGLSVGNGVSVTATLAAAQSEQDPVAYFVENLPIVVQAVLDTQAFQRAKAGFDAVEVEAPTYTPPAAATPAPVAQAAYVPPVAAPANVVQLPVAQPAPAPIPNASQGGVDPEAERLWTEFFQDPTQWHDNRVGKKNPKGPDFRHKTKKGADGYNLGLWINGKGNPAWVAEGLRQIGKG